MKIKPGWLYIDVEGDRRRLAAIIRIKSSSILGGDVVQDYIINNIDAQKVESWEFNDGPFEIIVDNELYWKYEEMLGNKQEMDI